MLHFLTEDIVTNDIAVFHQPFIGTLRFERAAEIHSDKGFHQMNKDLLARCRGNGRQVRKTRLEIIQNLDRILNHLALWRQDLWNLGGSGPRPDLCPEIRMGG
jgi:hypothetical protein